MNPRRRGSLWGHHRGCLSTGSMLLSSFTCLYHDYCPPQKKHKTSNYSKNYMQKKPRKTWKRLCIERYKKCMKCKTERQRQNCLEPCLLWFFLYIQSLQCAFPPSISASLSGYGFFAINLWLSQVFPVYFFLGKWLISVQFSPRKWPLRCEIMCGFQAKHIFVQSTDMIQFISIGWHWDGVSVISMNQKEM